MLGASPGGEPSGSYDIREIDGVLDEDPVLSADLLELARFVADYYLAPIGEVIQAMLPAGLPAWGAQRVWLTSQGALASPRNEAEAQILEHLLVEGRSRRSQLSAGDRTRGAAIQQMLADGRLASDAGASRSRGRYERAFEIAAGDPGVALEAVGKSQAGRSVVELLASLGRPATEDELLEAIGCGAGVLRRLSARGVLRVFEQPVRLSLDHQRLAGTVKRPADLTPGQAEAVRWLVDSLASGEYRACLLAGVTGSGKTEVYLRAAEAAVDAGRLAIDSAIGSRSCIRVSGAASGIKSGSDSVPARRASFSGRDRPSSRHFPTSDSSWSTKSTSRPTSRTTTLAIAHATSLCFVLARSGRPPSWCRRPPASSRAGMLTSAS